MLKRIKGEALPPAKKILVTYRLPEALVLALAKHNHQTGRTRNVTVEDALNHHRPLQPYIKAAEKELYGK